jgi:hypothetical protein
MDKIPHVWHTKFTAKTNSNHSLRMASFCFLPWFFTGTISNLWKSPHILSCIPHSKRYISQTPHVAR